jgi:hypothetical protein
MEIGFPSHFKVCSESRPNLKKGAGQKFHGTVSNLSSGSEIDKKKYVRLGIIDLGTNSVRFDVHVINKKHQARLLHREKLMIRLGQRVFLNGTLDSHAIQRAVQAFMSFRRTANILHTEKVLAFGTSALREAVDSDRLIEQIRTN